MNKQGFSTYIKRGVAATGGLFVLYALWRMPSGQLSAALLGFILIALLINTRWVISIPREWWRLSPNESMLLFAMLFFGGEAAVVAAAVTSLSLMLRTGRSWLSVCK